MKVGRFTTQKRYKNEPVTWIILYKVYLRFVKACHGHVYIYISISIYICLFGVRSKSPSLYIIFKYNLSLHISICMKLYIYIHICIHISEVHTKKSTAVVKQPNCTKPILRPTPKPRPKSRPSMETDMHQLDPWEVTWIIL